MPTTQYLSYPFNEASYLIQHPNGSGNFQDWKNMTQCEQYAWDSAESFKALHFTASPSAIVAELTSSANQYNQKSC